MRTTRPEQSQESQSIVCKQVTCNIVLMFVMTGNMGCGYVPTTPKSCACERVCFCIMHLHSEFGVGQRPRERGEEMIIRIYDLRWV